MVWQGVCGGEADDGERKLREPAHVSQLASKKLLSDYPRALWSGFLGCWSSAPDALPVTPALPVALPFAGRRGPVALLRLPPRPDPRRLPARLAAIALPRPSWPKALFTSLEQTQSRPRSARQPFSRAALLIFGMACSTLGRAQGRSLLPEAPAPEGIATPLRGAADLQVTTKSITLSQRSDFGWGSLPRCSQFSSHRGRPKRPHREGRSVCWPRAGVTMISPGKTEAGTAGMQPLPRDNLAGSSRR